MQNQPRFIRVGKAPGYLGMCRETFTRDIRPHLTEFRIGIRGKGFDRIEMDEVADAYMQSNIISHPVGETACLKDSSGTIVRRIGISKKSTEVSRLSKVLAQAREQKPKRS